ncbi:RNA methyltransferase [Phenylobacterium sp. LH3H17]|nr:RNA methyltransferase [Phenylobacterium sp. LH3H17]UTP41569.1 RNA methyltransferase [Phenylobacterium sp. LH3H17]
MVPIDDPDDPRVAAYRDVRERDLVGRQGLFVAEGEVVLRVLASSRLHRPVSLLIAQKRMAGLSETLAAIPDDVPIYAAGQAVMDAVVGFPIHRGILALGTRVAEPDPAELLGGLPARALVLVLSAIANHDNMGGLFRNAAAFGADAVLLDADCCDPLYRKAIRVSVGAALTKPFARLAPGADLLGLLEGQGFEAVALSPRGAATLAELSRPPRVAVVLGAEGAGLSEALLARARTVRIPMADGFDSLNVAVTAGVVLHHLAFAAPASGEG